MEIVFPNKFSFTNNKKKSPENSPSTIKVYNFFHLPMD